MINILCERDEKYYQSMVLRVKNRISESICDSDLPLYSAARHYMGKGKHLRALMLLLACGATGGEPSNAIDIAAGHEILHTFSLVQDDIMDKSEKRRGTDTVHIKYGLDTAILSADYLFLKAFESFNINFINHEFDNAKRSRLLKEILELGMVICEGQFLDLNFERKFNLAEDDYLDMIYKKTAVFFEKVCTIGGIIADTSEENIHSISEMGKCLGMAFQIKDDMLSFFGDEKVVEKSLVSDVEGGKITLPIIYVLQKASTSEKDFIKNLFEKQHVEPGNTDCLKKILQSYDVEDYAEGIAMKYISRAKDKLAELPYSYEIQILDGLLNFALYRNK